MTDRSEVGVLVVDDHIMIAQALASAMRGEGFSPVEHLPADSLNVEGAVALCERLRPAVALVDLNLGRHLSGLSVISSLAARDVKVIAFSAEESRVTAAETLEAGAVGFLNKAEPFDVIADHVRRAAAGELLVGVGRREQLLNDLREERAAVGGRLQLFESLSPKERDVLRALVEGKSAQQIADESYVSVRTVRNHIEAVRTKLKVKSQLAAVALARETRWQR